MKIVIFGLTISSSWGNGHATLWRGLCKALARTHHHVTFFERDVPYYSSSRDWCELPGGRLVLYPRWEDVSDAARKAIEGADVAIVTSYCPDGVAAANLVHDTATALSVFYDLDTPVTLFRLSEGEQPPYLDSDGLRNFDLVLSYTGGAALEELRSKLGARSVAPLYGHVDPDIHRPSAPLDRYRAGLSYLGTYASDRQTALEELFVDAARARPDIRFMMGGAQYPDEFPWLPNLWFVRHLPPEEHPAFFCSSRITLNVTRAPMVRMGWCPSGRIFEAAACGATLLSDHWQGLESFYTPGEEILLARNTADTIAALERDDAELTRIGRLARERTLDEHTSAHRAAALTRILEERSITCGA
jgi:spore maturation protein CgeB